MLRIPDHTRLGFLLIALLLTLLLILLPAATFADTVAIGDGTPAEDSTGATLRNVVELRRNLRAEIQTVARQLEAAQSEAEKKNLQSELDKLETDLQATRRNFEDIAAGVDISNLRQQEQKAFNFQEEVFSLLRPAIDEMKSMTARVRQKSTLKERIAHYEARLPVLQQALANIDRLIEASTDEAVVKSLKATREDWQQQQAFMQSEQQAARLQLDKLLAAETSLAEASQSYFKSFFQKRGLYLGMATLVVIGVILVSRLSMGLMRRHAPGFRREHRSFRVRLIELLHRVLTVLAAILGPMLVFYLVEDWVLFSLGLLLLIGIAWTLRQALPLYWSQMQLFLNVGSVREGERIHMENLPWRVQQINVYCTLSNPTAGISQRVPIAQMVGLKSRPAGPEEPWFPCRLGDWVILSDGNRGKVIGISPELVQLVQRGGAQLTYQTGDFLAASPRNLATNFRIKEVIGISYGLQKQSTTEIPNKLESYIQERIEQEGYSDKLLNLRVEFAQANSSSLDLVVIADFDGSLGDLYNRLRRAIQRWCVDACSEYDWEIPFPQLTLHGAVTAS